MSDSARLHRPSRSEREVFALLELILEDVATEADVARLESLLTTSEAARVAYVEYLDLHASLPAFKEAIGGQRTAVSQSSRHTPCAVTSQESVVISPLSVAEESPTTFSPPATNHGQRTTSPIPQSAIRNPQSASPSSFRTFRIPQSLQSRPLAFSLFVSTVATVSFLMLAAHIHVGGSSPREGIARQSNSPPIRLVAQFTRGYECRWSDSDESPFPGAHLWAGQTLELRQGIAELTFRSGAVALVEGPATFVLEGNNGGRLANGRLVAKVKTKEAKGFTVATPAATIVDLGTEFGVEVADDGSTEVQVFQGMVSATKLAGKRDVTVEVRAGQIFRSDDSRQVVLTKPEEAERFFALREHFVKEPSRPTARIQAYHQTLKGDPRLTAYYPFFLASGQGTKIVKNEALSSDEKSLEAELCDVGWGTGRWHGSRSLRFDGPLARQSVRIRGSEEKFSADKPLSIVVWFLIRSYDVPYQTLIAKGDRAWRLQRWIEADTLTFDTTIAVPENPGIADTNEVPLQNPVDDGRWHQIVCVHEPVSEAVSRLQLYLDGKLERTLDAPRCASNSEPVWIGSNSEWHDRGFNGWIDEVSIFAAALSAADVAKLHAAGDPYIQPTIPKHRASTISETEPTEP